MYVRVSVKYVLSLKGSALHIRFMITQFFRLARGASDLLSNFFRTKNDFKQYRYV